MKFGVVTFPGSNCDHDMHYVLKHLLGQESVQLWHKDTSLQGCDAIVLPGGFSYGDYLRSGALARFSPIMEKVMAFAAAGGYVVGICNGFQILCESGLLPGALLHNNTQKFICRNVYLQVQTDRTAFTSLCRPKQVLRVPVAHGEGRYFADADTLEQLNDQNRILFRYCNAEGNVSLEANPNGSAENIAGIRNKKGNVFGMMPHPERCADEVLGNTDGRVLFEGFIRRMEGKE
ncbi:MAG: phosphoribosylformylglycinamidine synthase subunit PurQ [Bacteroidales bacterium]|nr:phosphoribosylformylglycinamidine synthase subunit PurQ [Bacteroidales bacterium]